MPNIENISVRTTTKCPNGVIIGSLTNNDGVLSGFGAGEYFEIPNGRQADATYVVKFTTPNANPTVLKDILHIESWEAIEVTTAGKIYAWNFTSKAEVTLVATMALNTTYWIKAVHSGTTKTYYLSTDGENYSQVASFNDTATNLSFNSPAVIGNGSRQNQIDTRFWTGTIDLNGCYIEVGGDVVWQGMDYNNIQRIGGDEFDGQWIEKDSTLGNNITIAPNGSFNYSLATYLGDNTHDYEVEFQLYVETGTTSGNFAEIFLYSGNATSGVWNSRTTRVRTRAAYKQIAGGTYILPILKGAQSVTIWNQSSTVGNSAFTLTACRYRRIGLNGTHSDYISAIDVGGSQYDIQGKFLNGDWVSSDVQLYNGTIAGSTTKSCSLSSYLPNDGYAYEVWLTLRADTGTTSGNAITGRVGLSSTGTSNKIVCRQQTRTASNMTCCGNILQPVAARTVYVSNTAGDTSGTMVFTARGYRRIGTNG